MAAIHFAPTHWLRWLALAACVLLLAGCGQLLQLRSDILEGKNSITRFRGTVESPDCADCPMIIVALADMYDALTSRRTYRKAVRPEEALEALEREVREGRLALEAVRALRSGLRRGASEAEGHVLHL